MRNLSTQTSDEMGRVTRVPPLLINMRPTARKAQRTLNGFVDRGLSKKQLRSFETMLVRVTTALRLPVTWIENQEVRALLAFLSPSVSKTQLPNRKRLGNELLERVAEES